MRVKLLVSRVGPGICDKPGDEIEVSERDGAAMVAANQAVPVRKKRERAVKEPLDVETREG